MSESYVQVAADGAGKKVAMDQQTDSNANTVYLQKALMVGAPADAVDQLLDLNRQQLAVLRAILRVLTDSGNSRVTEEDFSSQTGVNFDG